MILQSVPSGVLLKILLDLAEGEQANGAPAECLYVGVFTLSDRGQVLEVTEEMIDQIVRNFNTLGESGRIPISVNHHTSAGTLAEARAVGWVVRLFKRTEGDRISLMMEPR